MSELRLTIGLPGSGKTAYALKLLNDSKWNWRRINWDEERKSRGINLHTFDRQAEEKMQKDCFDEALEFGLYGYNVIVDNTNLSEKTRNRWKGVAERANMIYTEIMMESTLEQCIERDSKRTGSERVGRAVIERMALFAELIPFSSWRRYVIVDMDGTLADNTHRLHHIITEPKNWDLFEALAIEDRPRQPIVDLVQLFHSKFYEILIVSGRMIDRAGKATESWLENWNIPYSHLFMRQGGDHRPDDVVKQEILNKLPKDQISYVLDDRDHVVDMWRRNGLTCLQVANGNF